MQTLLLAYFLAFFAIVIVWPTWRLWRRERINALVLPRDDSAHGVIGRWFKGLMAGMYVLVLALGFGLDVELLGRLRWAEHEAAEVVGRLKGRSVDDTRAVIEAAGFEWRGSRPRTLTAIHDELFAGWRAFNRCLA